MPWSFYYVARLVEEHFCKQWLRNRFWSLIWEVKSKQLVGKSQARAELAQKYALLAKNKAYKKVQEHEIL